MCVVLLLLLFAAVFFSYSQSCISFQVRVVCMCVCIEWLSKKYSEHSFVRLFGWSNWIGWCVLAHLQACVNECAINTICCWIHSTFFSTSFLFICSFSSLHCWFSFARSSNVSYNVHSVVVRLDVALDVLCVHVCGHTLPFA